MSASPSSSGSEKLHVAASPMIPFPAPAPITPGRSKRGAAQAAASKITDSATSMRSAIDDSGSEGSVSAGEEGEGTDATTDTFVGAPDGETDEATFDEADMTAAEPTDDEEFLSRKKKTPIKRKRASPAKKGESATKKAKTAKGKAKPTNGNADGKDGNGSDSSALTSVEDLEKKPKKQRKPRKPRAPKPEPVYVIPDVEQLPNPGFEGRLGFACLNTILRKRKPPVFCSRTCRIDSIKKNGMDFLKELGRQNVLDLAQLIQWNEENNIRFTRLSSEMFPFASHNDYGYDLEYAQEELKAAGDLANKYGHRLTTHPGQFTQLGSPRKEVVRNAIRDLKYHCEMLDRMGMGKDSVMIIHGGGTYNDKPAALERFRQNYKEMVPDNVKGRLVLENDEICYNVDDLLPLCEELSIPLVLDYHHHSIFPTAEQTLEDLMPRILATWENKGIRPKFHLSEERPGAVTVMERRAHSDRCKRLPTPLPSHIDLMIEAKDKEQAVFHLHRIYNLAPTVHANLRPPAEVETKHTQGRKSNKKKKKAAEGEEEQDDEGALDPEEAMIDMDGAEVTEPPEPADVKPAKKGRTPKKEANANATADSAGSPAKKKKATPAKRGRKKAIDAAEVEQDVQAEPSEKQEIEDLKLADVQENIIDTVPCEGTAKEQTQKAEE